MPPDADVARQQSTLTPEKRKAMGALMTGLGLACLDTAIANTALPSMARDLHVMPAESVWIINAYQLAMVSTMLPLAALADKLGLKRVFLSGLVIFTVASLCCAISPSLGALTLSRIVQGLGGGAMMTVNIALIRFIYPPHRLGRGVGLNALVAGSSMVIGPTVASLVLSVSNWPWLFALNVPIGLAAVALAVPYLPKPPPRSVHFDPVAAVMNGVGFGAIVFAFIEFSQQASLLVVLASAAIGITSMMLLIKREADHPAPMFPTDLFRRPVFSLSAATALCAFSVQGLAFVSLPFYFETTLGRDQIQTGFLMTPWSVCVAAIAPFAGRLSDRFPPAILGGIGLIVMSVSMMSLVWMPTDVSSIGIGIRMACCGIGFGFFQSPNLKAFMSSAPPERARSASGVVGTSRLLGQSSGSALVALSFGLSGHHGPLLSIVWGAVFALVGGIASGLRMVSKPDRR
ncbi:MFS transporter [Robbsia andropogonis]|uniref:MFS transporter n=1 Tax=Robbsia andropogonis TaxID=28092 RepID=UPI003D1C71E1